MNDTYELLKKLTSIHAVSGDTSEISMAIKNELENLKIDYFEDGFGTILCGNRDNPKKLITSHVDEVGFQVTKIEEDGKIRILPVGWVFANRLDHAVVYLNIGQKNLNGVILHQEELKQENITSFNSLYLDVGANSKKKAEEMGVKVGQTGSYRKEYIENGETIISASLDNKISQFVVLKLLQEDKSYLKANLFAFITDEEMQDQSANGICYQFNPELAVVLDYCPIHEKLGVAESLGESGKGPLVMYRGGAYIIHEEVRKYFESKITNKFQKSFLSADTIPSLEPFNFQNNGTTKAVNICIPASGYHGAAYSVRKQDITDFKNLTEEILKTPF